VSRCPHILRASWSHRPFGRAECLECHFVRVARWRRFAQWMNTWGVGLLLTGSIAAAIVGGMLFGGWMGLSR
jgi:hypothetical protein